MSPTRFIPDKAYQVVNLTKRTALARRAAAACTISARAMGLMGRRRVSELPVSWRGPGPDGLILPGCRSIHTCFMRMAIDVLWVDAANGVVRCAPALGPWRVTPVVWQAQTCLELASGAVASSLTEVGDRLGFAPVEP